jgi:hypothetical protein
MKARLLVASLMVILGACATPKVWEGKSNSYMQLYEGPGLGSSQVARVAFGIHDFKLLSATPYFTSVSGTKLSTEGEIYGTERFEVLPGSYEIQINLVFSGGMNDPFDGRWYETGQGFISGELKAGHQYEIVLSDEGSSLERTEWPAPGTALMPPIRKLHGSLIDKTAGQTIVAGKEMSWHWPQLGRGQTHPGPRRNLFERIDDIPSGTKVTVVQSPVDSTNATGTRVVAPKDVAVSSDAKVVPPALDFDEERMRTNAQNLQFAGEITFRFDVSEAGKVSNVRILTDVDEETAEAVREIVASSTVQPGTVDSKPAAFKDVEAKISFEETGQTGKTLLKIVAVVVLVPIAIILGLASGGGSLKFGD